MKETIALLVYLVIASLAISLATKRRIGNSLTAIILGFSLISGWGIANYDWIRKAQWQVPGLSVFQQQVTAIKEGAVDDIRKQAEEQRTSLSLLETSVNETHEKIGSQKEEIESLLDAIKKSEDDLKVQEEKMQEIGTNSEKIKAEVELIHGAVSNLSLLLTKVAWLQVQASGESSSERTQAAVQQIMDGLDDVVALVIPDPQARSEFVSNVMKSLPPPR